MKKLFTLLLVALLATSAAWANNRYQKVTDVSQLENGVGKKFIFAHVYSDVGYVSLPTYTTSFSYKYPKLSLFGGDGTILDLDKSNVTGICEMTLSGAEDSWNFALPDNKYLAVYSTATSTSMTSLADPTNNRTKWKVSSADGGIILTNGGYKVGNTNYPNRIIRQKSYNSKFECCPETSTYESYGYGFLYVQLEKAVLEASTETLDLGTTGLGSFTFTGTNLYQDVTVAIDEAESDKGFVITSPTSIPMDEAGNVEVVVEYNGLIDGAEGYITIKSDDVVETVKVTANAVPRPSGITIYIDKSSVGNFYAWNTAGADNGTWPGMAINSENLPETETMSGRECYVYTYDGTAEGLIFSDGSSQTGNITPEAGKIYKYLGGDICTMLYQFAITNDKNLNPDHSDGLQGIYVYTWDENSGNAQDVNKQLGEFPGKRVYDLEDNIKAGSLKVVNIDVRVSTNSATYHPYVIFSNDKGQQTEGMPIQASKAYRYINNEASVVEGIPVISSIFPDDAFRFGLSEFVDTGKNGVLTEDELGTKLNLAAGTVIPDAGPGILSRNVSNGFKVLNNLKGIEYFTNLTNFNLTPPSGLTCNIRELDLTICPNLETVSISSSPNLEVFKLPENTIKRIYLKSCNSIPKKLDTSTYSNLTYLHVDGCKSVKDIEISNNTVLDSLYLSSVSIPELNLASNTELKYLYLSSTKISSLDFTTLAKLGHLYLGSNSLLTGESIDVTNNPELYYIQIYNQNAFTTLDLTNNLKLEEIALISCSKLTQPTLNPELATLKALTISKCPKMSNCTFDLSKNVNLEQLTISQYSSSYTGTDSTTPGSATYNSLNNVIKGVGPQMKNLRYISTEGQRYDGNVLDLTGCEQLHHLDVLNCKLEKLSVTGCELLGNIDNATGSIPQNKNSQFFIFGNYLRSLDLEGVTLPYNFNLSTGTKVPFKDAEYVRHYSYNSQITPKLTPNVALVYHDRWAETPNYTYLVYVRLEQNPNDRYPADYEVDPSMAGELVPTLNGLFNKEAYNNRGSDVDVEFDYHRVRLWSRFATTKEGPVLDNVHGTTEIHALTGVDSPNWDENTTTDLSHVDPTHVLGKILSLGMYTVPCGHDRQYHETTGAEGTTAYVEPAYVGGTVSYLYSTLEEWEKEAEVTDGPSPMPQRDGGTGEDLDVYAYYNGDLMASATDENNYYKGITVQNNAVVEKYNNAIPFKFDWKVELTNDPESIVTAIKGIHGDLPALIEEIQYYNVMGQMSHKPFEGVNIVVTRYSDGTTTTQKVIR